MKLFSFSVDSVSMPLFSGVAIIAAALVVLAGKFQPGGYWYQPVIIVLIIALLFYRLLRPSRRSGHDFASRVSEQTSIVAIGSAEVSSFVDKLTRSIEQDQEHIFRISESCEQLSGLTDQVNRQVEETANHTHQAHGISDKGHRSVKDSMTVMSTLNQEADQAANQLVSLERNANEIQGIADVIKDIAFQTNLLALNATIEAAHAGDAGRGFTIVAREVRELASKTALATRNIENMLRETLNQIQDTAKVMEKVVERTGQMRGTMKTVGENFTNITTSVAETSSAMENIRGFMGRQVESVGRISTSIGHVLNSMEATGVSGKSVLQKALDLSNSAEQIFEHLADFNLNTFEQVMLDEARKGAKAIEALFKNAKKNGEIAEFDLFSGNYIPIPDTSPQKYRSDFDDFTDRELPGIQEPILSRHEQILFAIAQDANCYVPTHNDYLSLPLTGDYEKDLYYSRSKRLFNDRTGRRLSENTKPFLLQTYKRDTGEVLHDLSVPIYVNGRHWGAFRIGFQPSCKLYFAGEAVE